MSDFYHLSDEEQQLQYHLQPTTLESPSTTSSPLSPIQIQNQHIPFNWHPSLTMQSFDSNFSPHFPHSPRFLAFEQQRTMFNMIDRRSSVSHQHTSLLPSHLASVVSPPMLTNNALQSINQGMDAASLYGPSEPYQLSCEQQATTTDESRRLVEIKVEEDTLLQRSSSAASSFSSCRNTPVQKSAKRKRSLQTSVKETKHRKYAQRDDKEKHKEGAKVHELIDHGNGAIRGNDKLITNIQINQTVDQLDNELDFLRDECTTILIMLNSLRNAFSADISSTSVHSSRSTGSFSSMTNTINFMMESDGALLEQQQLQYNRNVCQSSSINNGTNNWGQSATNFEMERELRIAYDDLTLQVRQLEKKLDRLENKGRNLYLEMSDTTTATAERRQRSITREKKPILRSTHPTKNKVSKTRIKERSRRNNMTRSGIYYNRSN
ncbi:MAG: hypothetical protein EXX96DRAFT_562247 [Benjaminiella poitrasii]|nr:MAG: hypothetical protein EXX96DRAFT_562247 [Benjaminiella poitrasii]